MKPRDILIITALCVIFCGPLLSHPYNLGRGDWDQFYFYHEVPQITILTYHQFPFWNPFSCGGMSLIGNPQVRFLSPSFIITALLGVVPGLKIEILIHLILGIVGMFLLSNFLGIRGILRLLPGIIFIFSSPLVFHLTEGNMWQLPVVYLPFILLFYLKEPQSFRNLFIASLFIALMIYEGAHYPLIFSFIFLFVFSILTSFQKFSFRPFVRCLILLAWGVMLSGPKLFPTLELVSNYPRYTGAGDTELLQALISLPEIFLSPFQFMNKRIAFAGSCGWWAFGSYVGLGPAILYALSFTLFRKHWPLLLTSLLLLFIGLGNFAPLSPWGILHHLPIFRTMHITTRVFIVFVFVVGLLVSLYLQDLQQKAKNKRHMQIISLVMVVLITADLFLVNSKIFFEALRPFALKKSSIVTIFNTKPLADTPFHQVEMPYFDQFRFGAWSAMYSALYQNLGIVNGYEPVPFPRKALGMNQVEYQGEYFLLNKYGQVKQSYWSPNKLVFKLDLKDRDQLIINQNFEKNWKTVPSRPVREHKGLLAIDVSPDLKQIVVYYFPISFLWGIGATIFAVGTFLLIRKV